LHNEDMTFVKPLERLAYL